MWTDNYIPRDESNELLQHQDSSNTTDCTTAGKVPSLDITPKLHITTNTSLQTCTHTHECCKVASAVLLLTLVMYDSARSPYHATAGIFCICRDSKLIYFVLRNMNSFKCFITGYVSPVQKALKTFNMTYNKHVGNAHYAYQQSTVFNTPNATQSHSLFTMS